MNMKKLSEIPGIEKLVAKLNVEMDAPDHGELLSVSLFPQSNTTLRGSGAKPTNADLITAFFFFNKGGNMENKRTQK